MEPHHANSAAAKRLLATLRRDHHHMLEHLSDLDRHMGAIGSRAVSSGSLRSLITELEQRLATHMRVGDDTLFPALEQAVPETAVSLAALREDHQELRGLLSALALRLEEPRETVRDGQLRVLARDLVDLLRLHVDREQRIVFTVASHVLRADELTALTSRIGQTSHSPSSGITRRRTGRAS